MNLEQLNTDIATYQLHRVHYEHKLEIIRTLFYGFPAESLIDEIDELVNHVDSLYIELGRLNQDSEDGSFDITSYKITHIERMLADRKIKDIPTDFSKFFPEDTEEFNEYRSNLRPSSYIIEEIEDVKGGLIEITSGLNPAESLLTEDDESTEKLIQNLAEFWDSFRRHAINLCKIL